MSQLRSAGVSVRSVTKMYGSFRALDDVSVDIEQGEFLALLGPSGCGKTTLLRSIAGFVQPTNGSIVISGKDVSSVPPYKRDVNTVFQSYALFPHMTVAENVAYGPRRLGKSKSEVRERVAESLSLVGLDHLKDRRPSQLSGGQQQRVALARALANRPKVLLLDEPLAALDLQLRKQMQIELKHMQRRLGMTFVLVTHDQEEALVMADRIAVMNAGRIEQIGRGDDIYWRPKNRFVATFIGATNIIEGFVADDGRAILDPWADGSTDGAADNKLRTATFSLRMEDVKLGASAASDHSTIKVTIVEKIFCGGTTYLYGRTASGKAIISSSMSPRDAESIRCGDDVQLHWASENVAVLSD